MTLCANCEHPLHDHGDRAIGACMRGVPPLGEATRRYISCPCPAYSTKQEAS